MWQVLIKGSLQVCLLDIENLNLKQYTSIPVYLKKFASEAVVCLCTYSVFSSFREGFEEKKGKGKEKGGASLPSGGGGAASGPYVQRVMDDAREDEMEVRKNGMEGCLYKMMNGTTRGISMLPPP